MKCIVLAISVLITSHISTAAPKKHRDPEQVGQRKVGRGLNFYSQSRELALGKELARDVEYSTHLLEDPIVGEYVNRLGQNLAAQSDARYIFAIKIIRSEEVNAVALPGGFIFINTGLIRAAADEAELAAAVAHEIAHIGAHHYTRRASWQQVLSIATIPLAFAGGWPGLVLQQATALAAPLAFQKFSRAAESEADMLGVQYLYRAGYDPAAFVNFLERLSRGQQSRTGIFARALSGHPAFGSRIHAVQKQIQRDLSPVSQYVLETSEFELIKERLIAIENGNRLSRRLLPPSADSDERPLLKRRD